MANDGQMDLIPLDQMSPRSAGITAVDCDVAVRAYYVLDEINTSERFWRC